MQSKKPRWVQLHTELLLNFNVQGSREKNHLFSKIALADEPGRIHPDIMVHLPGESFQDRELYVTVNPLP